MSTPPDARGQDPGHAQAAPPPHQDTRPLDGILIIDKPLGPTSMDICAKVRWKLRQGGAPKRVKVGHAGTLDPLATGVLVVLVGRATRLCDQLMATRKAYLTTIDLSCFSTTDDAEGEKTLVEISTPPTRAQIEAAIPRFVGTIMQSPPAFSAIKVGGRAAYKDARAGKPLDLPPRPVRIDAIGIVDYAFPLLTLNIDCGKGVYIRSLARDLGRHLGTGGTLAALRRTRVGEYSIEQARTMDSLPEKMVQSDLDTSPAPAAPLASGPSHDGVGGDPESEADEISQAEPG
jgi:tRNA pseudouridine55 synthase